MGGGVNRPEAISKGPYWDQNSIKAARDAYAKLPGAIAEPKFQGNSQPSQAEYDKLASMKASGDKSGVDAFWADYDARRQAFDKSRSIYNDSFNKFIDQSEWKNYQPGPIRIDDPVPGTKYTNTGPIGTGGNLVVAPGSAPAAQAAPVGQAADGQPLAVSNKTRQRGKKSNLTLLGNNDLLGGATNSKTLLGE